MPTFTVKVPDDDEGEDLGEYESDYLPRKGDSFALWHPRLTGNRRIPFVGVVRQVEFEAHCGEYEEGAYDREAGTAHAVVWVDEAYAAPKRYCDCSPADRAVMAAKRAADPPGEGDGEDDDECEHCGGEKTA